MGERAQQHEMDSLRGTSLFSSVLFIAVAAMVAVVALFLLSGLGTSRMILPGAGRVAVVVMVMALSLSGVLMSILLDLPDITRGTLVVLFAAALLCSGFALVAWFAVNGASGFWL